MDFALTTEQDDFRRTVAQLVKERSPLPAVRDAGANELGYDPAVWSGMCRQLGLPGLLVPERFDGAGASTIESAVVMEELGRGLVPSPYLATVGLGVLPLLALGTDEQKKALLPEVCAGERTLTAAIVEPETAAGSQGLAMRAEPAGEQVTLTGTKTHVVDGHTATTILVVARYGDGAGFFLVDGDAAGLSRQRVETFDLTRSLATLDLDAVRAEPLGEPLSWTAVDDLLDGARTLLAAEMVGGIDGALTMAVEYAGVRHQFDRPIGSFQAIKHGCADVAVELDAARAATRYAAYLAAVGDAEFPVAARVAHATAAAGFGLAAGWNIQVHGGVGFTWEHDAHLYYRRAMSDGVLLDTPRDDWLRVADLIGVSTT